MIKTIPHKSELKLKNPENLNFKRKIGSTIYVVNAHFNDTSKEDMVSKVKSLMTR